MLNYYTIRIILSIIFICLIYFFILKRKVLVKKKIILCLLLFMCYFLIWGINYEMYLLKFRNIQEIFSYYFPHKEIFKIYKFDDYAWALYKTSSSYGTVSFIKNGNNWQSDRLLAIDKSHTQYYDNCNISIKILKQKKSAIIIIFYTKQDYKNIIIEDSLSTAFDSVNSKNNHIFVGIINYENIDNYSLKIGDKEHKLQIG